MGDRALSLAPNREGMNLKNPPTLADACIATAFTKDRLFGIYGKANYTTLMRIPYARKFVLDATMSRYLADLSRTFCPAVSASATSCSKISADGTTATHRNVD